GSIADVDFGVIASHVVLIGLGATLAAGYFWGAVIRRGPLPVLPGGQDLSLGIVPTGTALGVLDLLFLVFVVIQLRYFFGGAELIERTIGLTYAEYARRGFFELVTASALVLPILVGGDWALRHEPREHQRTFRFLAGLLLVLLAVVMASPSKGPRARARRGAPGRAPSSSSASRPRRAASPRSPRASSVPRAPPPPGTCPDPR